MAKFVSLPTICLLLLALTLGLANSARHLNEGMMFTPADQLPSLPSVEEPSKTFLPSGQAPATAAADDSPTNADTSTTAPAAAAAAAPADDAPAADDSTTTSTTTAAAAPTDDTGKADESTTTKTAEPEAAAPADETPAADKDSTTTTTTAAPAAAAQAEDTPAADDTEAEDDSPTTAAPAAAPDKGSAAGETEHPGHPAFTFFMHDVLGGSSASGRIVTGLIATSDVNGIPFSRPNNQVFPVSNGVPLMNNGNLLNNNNVPFVAGLTGQNQQQSQTIIQNTGSNTVVNGGDNNQAFVTPGQLPTGATLQKLLFGSITVIDDELTEGHELGAGVIGRGQGFYLASSLDGESHTMAFTAVFHPGHHNHEEEDTLSFFGVHRTASPISQMAIIGGTGKYENAKGYTTIEAMPPQDQHTTDGVDTVAKFSVYLTS